MQTIPATERRALRARAHHLHPVVAIGTHGLTDAVLHEIDIALKAHELIKIRVWSDVRADRDAFLERICRALDCAPVQHVGKLLIVWRRNPDLKSENAASKVSPARDPAKRRRPAATTKRRDDKSPRSRLAPPSGAPRAPSRRRRADGIVAPDDRVNDQSRRRRRAH
ncbi:MAG TPA: YhbY family RNA-binding protein [Casimicrobiaceae bacterium]|jgi:putative YhbY family RNA-binding protein